MATVVSVVRRRALVLVLVLAAAVLAMVPEAPSSAHELSPNRLFAVSGAPSDAGGTSCATSTLYELSPATGTVIATVGATGTSGLSGIAFDPTSSVLYGVRDPGPCGGTAQLFTISTTTGAATPVGPTVAGISDLAFTKSGELWAWRDGDDDLYRVDKTSGVASRVGESGVATTDAGISVSPADTLWMMSGNALYTVDRTSGAAQLGFNFSPASLTGAMAFDGRDIPHVVELGAGTSTLRYIDREPGDVVTLGAIAHNGSAVARISGLAFLPTPAVTAAGDNLYGTTSFGDLLSISPATGAGGYVGRISILEDSTIGVDCDPDRPADDTICVRHDGQRLSPFEPTAGLPAGAAVNTAPGRTYRALEYIDHALYTVANDAANRPFGRLNPATGAFTSIGNTSLAHPVVGLAWNGTTLYGLTGGGGASQLVRINRSTGAVTSVGSTGLTLGGLEFGPGGVLYAGGGEPGGTSSAGSLYRVDPSTGGAVQVGPTGYPELTNLTALNAAPHVVAPIADASVVAGNPPLTFQLSGVFDDANVHQTLTYSASSSVADAVSVSVSGSTLTVTPGSSPTRVTVTVTATDPAGESVSDFFDIVPPEYIPLVPARVLDTRDGTGTQTAGKVGPQGLIDLQIMGRGGVPSGGVGSVVMNVTSTEATEPSFITVHPSGQARPNASNLNTEPGQDTPNLVVVKLGAGGRVTLFNNAGAGHLVADVLGYFPAGSPFTGLTPSRLLDTRDGTGIGNPSPVVPLGSIELQVTGRGGVPGTGVGSVILNVTSTAATAPSFVTAWPSGQARPNASNLNTEPGQDTPNLVVVKVGAGGKVALYNNAGLGHLVADVLGYFPTGSTFTGLTPARVLDTRDGTGVGAAGPLGPTSTITLDVTGVGEVPQSGVGAVVLNVTSTQSSQASFVTVYPGDAARPNASNLNTEPGQDTPNLVVVKVGADGTVRLYNDNGTGHLVADVLGWFPR